MNEENKGDEEKQQMFMYIEENTFKIWNDAPLPGIDIILIRMRELDRKCHFIFHRKHPLEDEKER